MDRAINMAKEKGLNLDFEVEFHPFLLDPTLKKDNFSIFFGDLESK